MKHSKTLAIALALGAALGCSDSTEPIPPGTSLLTFNLCSDLVSHPFGWFAYRNEGGEWTKVTAGSNGSFSFYATEKVSFAIAISFFGTSITQVVNASANELKAAGAVACSDEFGSRTLGGSVAGVTGEQSANISAGAAFDVAYASDLNWQLTDLPTRAVDVVATRYENFLTQASQRVLIRRSVTPNNGTIPALDFNSTTESAPLESATATFTGIGTSESLDVGSAILTANGTLHELMQPSASLLVSMSAAVNYVSVPPPLRAANDLHVIQAYLYNPDGTRTLEHYYASPAAKTLAFGPMVGTPTITTLATTPYVRPRAMLASQPEYGGGVLVEFGHMTGASSGNVVAVLTTAGFVGSVPTTWDISVPDMTAAGYSAGAGLQGTDYSWSVTAMSGTGSSSLNGVSAADGATMTTATRGTEGIITFGSRGRLLPVHPRLLSRIARSGGRLRAK